MSVCLSAVDPLKLKPSSSHRSLLISFLSDSIIYRKRDMCTVMENQVCFPERSALQPFSLHDAQKLLLSRAGKRQAVLLIHEHRIALHAEHMMHIDQK